MATDKLTTNDLPAKTTVDSNSKKKKAGAKPATSKKAGTAKKTVASEPLVPATAPKASSPAKKTATTKKVSSKEVTAQTVSKKTASPKNTTEKKSLTVTFQVKFHTSFGQNLFVLGNHPLLGDGDVSKALPMHYFNDGIWTASLYWDDEQLPKDTIVYNYILKNPDGTLSYDWGKDKFFIPATYTTQQVLIKDAWNFAGYFENAFYTEPFQKVLLKENHTAVKIAVPKKVTHVFKAKAPLLAKGQTLCLLGSAASLNEWDSTEPVLMSSAEGEDAYSVSLNLSKDVFPVAYKYGIYDIEKKQFQSFEEGNNRVLYEAAEADKLTIVNDGFAVFPIAHWKGAGVAIPVFSLRSSQSFGVGEFADIKLLTDWCISVGLKLIQILPINDTTATHTWTDSYPYAAISAFALHPMYLNLKQVAGEKHSAIVEQL
ncbi:MAG: 4-alpha-glucanotransferase, partial [Bacteroidota bacterium]|nr:4-alpha-glucanotransferase [Bacteroidota bacterium]